MARRLSISTAWDETRAILGRDGKLIISVALALIALPLTIAGLIAPPAALSGDEPPSWFPLLSFLVALIGMAGQMAIIRLALTSSTVADAIAHGFRRLLPAFLALLLFGLALAILMVPVLLLLAGPGALQAAAKGVASPQLGGAVLLVVLIVLAIAVRFQLVMPVTSAEPGGPIRILRRSWQITKGHYWKLLAFIFLTLLLGFIVVLYLGQVMGGILARTLFGEVDPITVGALIAALIAAAAQAVFAAILSVMLARIYRQVTDEPEASVPSSGT
jgi:hypothetical protein